MRIFYVIFCSVVLASCSRTGGTSLVPAGLPNGGAPGLNAAVGSEPSLAQPDRDHGDEVLYGFKGGSADGEYPWAGLLAVNGEFYGTTMVGGTAGAGTVFKVSKSGKESVLYSFKKSPDGANPYSVLIALNGKLYGTTLFGGTGTCGTGYYVGCGTVFEVSKSGKESVLHSFTGGADGASPYAGLLALNGVLYGTTQRGGSSTCPLGTPGCGTVFEVSTSGEESVLYTFTGGTDGGNPSGTLIALNGALYGTTYGGGVSNGYGTVFTVTTSGQESVIYGFNPNGSSGDGIAPWAGVTAVNGNLYGTTLLGGTACFSSKEGCGTVFEVSTSGKERVLHSFGSSLGDGETPWAGLLAAKGALYGTTQSGGASVHGTAFRITLSGKERVLHSFTGPPDGTGPYAGLIDVNGALYGTTLTGGGSGCSSAGCGTVFSVKP